MNYACAIPVVVGLLIAVGCGEVGEIGRNVSLERRLPPPDVVRRVAESGDAEAQVTLGWMHETGVGAKQDPDAAWRWYRKSAEQGNVLAQYALGGLYLRGIGAPRDPAKAAEWYLKSAAQGNASAQYKLGFLYEHGLGVAQDYRTAAEWYVRAGRGWREEGSYPLGAERVAGPLPQPSVLTPPPREPPLPPVEDSARASLAQSPPPDDAALVPPEPAAEPNVPGGVDRPPPAAPVPAPEPSVAIAPPEQPAPAIAPDATRAVAMAKEEARVMGGEQSAPAAVPEASAVGRVWVHISSFRTRRYARKHWDELTRRHGELLGGYELDLARVDLGAEKGVWIRVRAGPLPGLDAAKALCERLRARGLYCAPQLR